MRQNNARKVLNTLEGGSVAARRPRGSRSNYRPTHLPHLRVMLFGLRQFPDPLQPPLNDPPFGPEPDVPVQDPDPSQNRDVPVREPDPAEPNQI